LVYQVAAATEQGGFLIPDAGPISQGSFYNAATGHFDINRNGSELSLLQKTGEK